jgi:hypothetical protein
VLVIEEESCECNFVCFLPLSLAAKSVRLIHYAVQPDLRLSTRIAVSGFMLRNALLHNEPEASPGRL